MSIPVAEQQLTAALDKAFVRWSVAMPIDLSRIVASYAVLRVQWDARIGGVPDGLVELSADGRAALLVRHGQDLRTQRRHWPWVVSSHPISAMTLVPDAPQLRRWWLRVDAVPHCIGVGVAFKDMDLRAVHTSNPLSCSRSYSLSTASTSLFHNGHYTDEPKTGFTLVQRLPTLLRFTADLTAGTVSIRSLVHRSSRVREGMSVTVIPPLSPDVVWIPQSALTMANKQEQRRHDKEKAAAAAAAEAKTASAAVSYKREPDDTVWVTGLKDLSNMHAFCCLFARGSAVCLMEGDQDGGPLAPELPPDTPATAHLNKITA
jgi:hypothetical protein